VATAQDGQQGYKVIPLRYAEANALAATVRGSLTTTAGRRSPQVVPDARTNSVIVTCAPDELGQIEKLIASLDVEVKKQ
jgi:type II secretory pathway component HofQ